MNFFNGVKILDNVKEIVYIDSCCYYIEVGENILLDFIVNLIFIIFIVNEN